MEELYKGSDEDILKVQEDLLTYIRITIKKYKEEKIYKFLDDCLDIYMPVVYNGTLLYDTSHRPYKNQQIRLNLLPSFKGETVLDIGCNTGFLTYQAAKQAKYCYGVDINPATLAIPGDILSYRNKITNIEFHECSLWRLYTVIEKTVDNILILSIFNSKVIVDLLPLIIEFCRKNIYIEPTNYEHLDQEQLIEKNMTLFEKFGSVTFLGITDYQERGLFQISVNK